ncbi:unnamed protein product [Trichogramma brassicae]|uniref:Uncharacterized protein n=1 Tax=Trichogramma brassicae TaxID=86971 RepID=A0A6H5IYC1_9HYME|nr:unnamed protein product [Trichogramma brassicae]
MSSAEQRLLSCARRKRLCLYNNCLHKVALVSTSARRHRDCLICPRQHHTTKAFTLISRDGRGQGNGGRSGGQCPASALQKAHLDVDHGLGATVVHPGRTPSYGLQVLSPKKSEFNCKRLHFTILSESSRTFSPKRSRVNFESWPSHPPHIRGTRVGRTPRVDRACQRVWTLCSTAVMFFPVESIYERRSRQRTCWKKPLLPHKRRVFGWILKTDPRCSIRADDKYKNDACGRAFSFCEIEPSISSPSQRPLELDDVPSSCMATSVSMRTIGAVRSCFVETPSTGQQRRRLFVVQLRRSQRRADLSISRYAARLNQVY